MSDAILRRTSRRRVQEPASPGRSSQQQPARPQSWAGKTPQEILARYQPGKAPPLKVLEVLIKLFNTQHTALEKTVSHKTRQERAQFLRRFFRDLKQKAGFKGTLEEFFVFMRTDKQFYLPNNDAGAQEYIDRATFHIEEMKKKLTEAGATVELK